MYKYILPLIAIIFFSGCFGEVKPVFNTKSSIKSFDAEDTYILLALRAEELKDYNSSAVIFNTLYEKSHKKEYLYKSLQNDLLSKKYTKVVDKIDKLIKDGLKDNYLIRIKVLALVKLNKDEKARQLAIGLVELSHEVNDYILVSDIYVKQKKYDTAVKYLESAYVQNYNEKILDKIAIVLYVNLQRKKDAIAHLQTHLRVHGCSKLICSRLIGFYSNDNDIDGLLSIYIRYYDMYKNDKVAKKIAQIYTYNKNYIKLMSFLKESKIDNKLLLELYINAKNYKEAFPLAYELYKKTGEINYLGQSAIFEYESSRTKKNKIMQKRVIKRLKEVIKTKENSLYLNYLGYLLIDHEIDVKAGMSYVKKALKIEPNSIYYFDSLAWGYYKLGQCKKANKIMKKIIKLKGDTDDEVITHINAINRCLKNKRRKGKKK